MKSFRFGLIPIIGLGILAAPLLWYISAGPDDSDPDLPPGKALIGKDEYRRLRDEHFGMLRGLDTLEQDSRGRAIREMEQDERELETNLGGDLIGGSWKPLGPAPIPNGQTVGRSDPVSGRTVALAIHPSNPNIVYAGTAQGGLYRTLDGGSTWKPLLDSAQSLAAGSVAIAPSDPSIVYVGTGESSFSSDSFFGAGVYRINNADSPNPIVTGPLTRDALNADVLTGRGTGRVLVHPTDANTIFVATVSGAAGFGSTTGATFPPRGLYRSTNAGDANPVFTRLTVSGAATDRPVLDAVMEPGNPNRMFVSLVDSTANGDGGVYFTSNALDPSPTFTRLLVTGSSNELGRTELAIQKTGNTVTVYAATGTSSGQVHKAVYDTTAPGTPTFAMTVDNNFCSPQCFYDQAIAVDPNDANRVYLGGSPQLAFGISTNGGTSFTSSSTGLHVDSHAIAVAPSDSNIIYFGSDGGVWKSVNAGASWVSQNNSTFSATQFQSVGVHPIDRHYTIGGTQDNGTEYLFPDGTTWTRSVGGDGGPAIIDSRSSSPTSVVAYHTFFNSTNSQIGFQRSTTTAANGNPLWGAFMGCGGTANGIACTDRTLFYAPMVLGPNAPGGAGDTVYFGTEKLYRSINQGTTMTPVSQSMSTTGNERISAIGISPQNDDIRLIGSTLGRIHYSNTAAATTMTDITGAMPARYVARIAIDPTNANIAYVALNGFGIPNQHVMKTTNLNSPTPTWTPAGFGIPDVPTNGLVIDPANPSILYAGTDIGVFRSTDGAATWLPFSTGLPRVAVFEIVIQPTHRILKIATHGRGIWEFDLDPRKTPFDFDGDNKTDIGIFRPSVGQWWINRSSDSQTFALQFGTTTDEIVPTDFTGDGKTDIAVWRPSSGDWFVLRSEDSSFFAFPFGTTGDMPAPADFDNDGKSDAAVFRPSNGTWYIQRSSGGTTIAGFGASGDVPVAADYDGDGSADLAIYRPANGQWWLNRSTAGVVVAQFGNAADKAVQGDYTGDRKADIAFWRPATGDWFILRSEDFSYYSGPFGSNGDVPAPGDYDGDGKFDTTIFRPSTATWFSQRSTAGTLIQQFGATGDQPVANAFVP
ncbi:MAG TPA: VCBS repeat-containing protein [Pyrinomonadaceae bacterium]|nr:VCBS repeat-containing protein [Pyrinomonadaceae bacterium]